MDKKRFCTKEIKRNQILPYEAEKDGVFLIFAISDRLGHTVKQRLKRFIGDVKCEVFSKKDDIPLWENEKTVIVLGNDWQSCDSILESLEHFANGLSRRKWMYLKV